MTLDPPPSSVYFLEGRAAGRAAVASDGSTTRPTRGREGTVRRRVGGRGRRAWVGIGGRAVAALGTLLALGPLGCASGGSPGSGGDEAAAYGAASPEDAVQSFLNAAKRDDYRAMSRLFGGTEGPAERRLGRTEAEQRMFVLASLLEHESYAMRRSGLTEGVGLLRFLVDMTGTRNGAVTVPVVVASHQGRWYVQQVVTRPLTGTSR